MAEVQRLIRSLALLALAWALLLPATAAGGIRCGGRLVSEGEHVSDLLAVCGQPDYREQIAGAYLPGVGVVVAEERWYYNFGPRDLLRVIRIQDGRVVGIDTPDYGFDESVRGDCDPDALRVGMSGFELLTRCGTPAYKDTRLQLFPADPPMHPFGRVIPIEEWVYEFGPGSFTRILTLSEGEVRRIEVGRRR